MPQITYPDKAIGDLYRAVEANEVKAVVNAKMDRPNGLVSGGAITIGSFGGSGTNNDIKVAAGSYFISPDFFVFPETPDESPWLDVALCPGGQSRYVEIVGTTTGITIRDGTPSTIPSHPTIATNEVSLGWILVGDSVIEEPAVSSDILTKNFTDQTILTSGTFVLECASADFPVFYVRMESATSTMDFVNYWNVVEGIIFLDVRVASTTINFTNVGNKYEGGVLITNKVLDFGVYRVTFGYLYGSYYFDFGLVSGIIHPLNDVLSVGNDAGTEQIKNIGDATEETDAMSYGQFLRGLAGLTSYFFSSTNSDIATYESMPDLANYTSAAEANNGGVVVSTTPTSLGKFATNSGFPNVTKIPIGLFSAYVEVQKGAGANNYATFFKLYKRNLAGTETLLVTSDYSSEVSVNTRQQVTVSAFIANPITLLATDRLVIEWLSVMTASTATITMYYDGATNARFAMPVVSASGGGISDGDKGDIIVSGSGSTLTIDAGAVTLAKQADVAAGTVFYRKTAGTGSPEVQTLATLKTDLALVADAINNGTLDVAPSQNAVFDALALKEDIGTVASVSTAGVITGMSSAGVSLVRLTTTNPTGLGGIANGVSLKDLYVFNDTGNTLTIYNEYSGEGVAANKIISGADLTWANQQMLHVKYDSTESRWVVVSLGGNTYFPNLAGIGTRLVEASSTGQEQAIIQTLDIDFSGAQQTSATTASWTGVNEVNIAGLQQGQLYIDVSGGYRYECHRNDYCSRTPVINVETFTTNSLYPIFEVTGTSGTLAEDSAYVLNNASQVVMNLPTVGTFGLVIIVHAKGAGGGRINTSAAQQIVGTSGTQPTAGQDISFPQHSAITLKCTTGHATAAVWSIVSVNPATTITII